jgi:hypothetical protein
LASGHVQLTLLFQDRSGRVPIHSDRECR